MSTYHRPKTRGRPIFLTVCLAHRRSRLLIEEIDILRDAIRVTRNRRPVKIDAWVVLPDHVHAIWSLQDDDPKYSERWGAIKARFTKFVRLKLKESMPRRPGFTPVPDLPTDLPVMQFGRFAGINPGLRDGKGECAIWQRRFWDHHIRDEADYAAHLRYCWMNPVKHGLTTRPVDWPYSSIHWDIRLRRVAPDFAGDVVDGTFGEMA